MPGVRKCREFNEVQRLGTAARVEPGGREHCREIAKESGLTLSAQKAWAWLAQGGFTNDVLGQAVIGGFDLTSLNQVTQRFLNEDLHWQANDRNVFRLQLDGATKTTIPDYRQGKVVARFGSKDTPEAEAITSAVAKYLAAK